MTAKKKVFSSEKLLSFSAIFISIVTLIIFVRQTNIMEQQSRLSVLPYLMMETSNNSQDNTFIIEIVNYGVGPAIIENRDISYKGKQFAEEFPEFIKSNFKESDSINMLSYSTLQKGLAIPAGASRTVIKVGGSQTSYETFLQVLQKLQQEDFGYNITYKSIHGDTWQISGSDEIPVQID